MKFSLSRIAGIVILLMWAVSLVLPVFTTCRPGYDHVGGWFLLGFGWMGVMMLQPAWFANWLIVIIATILLAERRAPIWLGIVTAIVAGAAWFFTAWYDDTGDVPICHYHAGFWLWLATAVAALLATFLPRRYAVQSTSRSSDPPHA
jgi:hypothetical protein